MAAMYDVVVVLGIFGVRRGILIMIMEMMSIAVVINIIIISSSSIMYRLLV